eukprot:1052249_1
MIHAFLIRIIHFILHCTQFLYIFNESISCIALHNKINVNSECIIRCNLCINRVHILFQYILCFFTAPNVCTYLMNRFRALLFTTKSMSIVSALFAVICALI